MRHFKGEARWQTFWKHTEQFGLDLAGNRELQRCLELETECFQNLLSAAHRANARADPGARCTGQKATCKSQG